HGLRELMEKLPRYLDVPTIANPTTLLERVRTLNQSWDKTLKRSKCHNDGLWYGEIDGFLQKFLKTANEFFEQLKVDRPTRKEQVVRIIRKLDLQERPFQDPLKTSTLRNGTESVAILKMCLITMRQRRLKGSSCGFPH